jgi:hypothetical protein
MFEFSLHFETIDWINSSDVKLKRIGLTGQLCLTPALILTGLVSSDWEVLTVVVAFE